MSKYQEALDWLEHYEYFAGDCYMELQVDCDFNEIFKILQELIDNYSKLEKALDRACKELAISPHCWDLSERGCDGQCAKCWKEWFLKDE